MSEVATKHIFKSKATLKAKYFNAGRENGPWSVKEGSGLRRWEVHYERPSE